MLPKPRKIHSRMTIHNAVHNVVHNTVNNAVHNVAQYSVTIVMKQHQEAYKNTVITFKATIVLQIPLHLRHISISNNSSAILQ